MRRSYSRYLCVLRCEQRCEYGTTDMTTCCRLRVVLVLWRLWTALIASEEGMFSIEYSR